jgi:hypothetical protein
MVVSGCNRADAVEAVNMATVALANHSGPRDDGERAELIAAALGCPRLEAVAAVAEARELLESTA